MRDTIVNSFDVWTAAQGIKSKTRINSVNNISLDGIARLRELILELAVRGKLVPQDSNDEPANELIKKIVKEKEGLLKEGKIKKQTPLPKITEEEIPFNLPKSWSWERLQNLSVYIQRGKGPKYSLDGKIQVVSQKCIQWTGFNLSLAKYIEDSSIKDYQPERFLINNDLLWNSTGTGTVGRINVVNNINLNSIVADSHVTVIRPIFINSFFLCNFLSSPSIQKRIKPGSNNALVSGSTNQVELNTSSVNYILAPIPPLAEQHRIVAKVDELMALCDKLEDDQFKNLKTHQVLIKTLLETLTQAADANELQAAWERMSVHFDTLFCTEDSIEQLKQTILQLAVMGKLVQQDPNDKPASELMKKIQKEKEKLIENSRAKKEASLKKITEDEIPFNIPKSWIWAKPEEFSNKITDGEHFRPETQNEGIYFLSAKDIRAYGVSLDDPLFVSKEIAEAALKRCNPEKGDILIVSRGGTVGRMCTVDIDDVFCLLGSVILIKPTSPINTEYLKILMKSPHVFNKLITASGSTAQPAIYLRDIKKIIFPIAPLEEQRRIVEKVDDLFRICDTLIDKLLKSKDIKVLLSKTIVEKAVE